VTGAACSAQQQRESDQTGERTEQGGQRGQRAGRRAGGRRDARDRSQRHDTDHTDRSAADGERAGDRRQHREQHHDGADQHQLVRRAERADREVLQPHRRRVHDRAADRDDRRGPWAREHRGELGTAQRHPGREQARDGAGRAQRPRDAGRAQRPRCPGSGCLAFLGRHTVHPLPAGRRIGGR
jgi:hypothetical protein